MIPRYLTLRNFLSYRATSLDFRGLQLACICGPNGAGKSSLLEAMAWAVWGQSRVENEDDLIHTGETEAQVSFVLDIQGASYRIIRTRHRNQATHLEFQAQMSTSQEFRSLTGRSLRQTQSLIRQHLHLDYQTFINSAYLRQGRADEFMLKRPTERKQLLADLLNLNDYETLAEAARDQAKQYKSQLILLSQNQSRISQELETLAGLEEQKTILKTNIDQQRQVLEELQAQRQTLQNLWQTQALWQQRLDYANHHLSQLEAEYHRSESQYHQAQAQLDQYQPLLAAAPQIQAQYETYQVYARQDQEFATQAGHYQTLAHRCQELQQALDQEARQLQQQIQACQSQQQLLRQQQDQWRNLLAKEPEIQRALDQLNQARQHLAAYDHRQTQAFPLLQRQRELELEQSRQTSHLVARMDQLRHQARQLQQQQAQQPQLQQAVLEVQGQISHLEKQRVYLHHLQEKGLERRRFMEQLQAKQRDLETQLGGLEQKIQLLAVPDAACPLCQRPLDELHFTIVKKRHQQEQQDLLDQIWVIREQLAVSEREIQVLRREYREVEQQCRAFEHCLEQRGRLEAQLGTTTGLGTQLQQIFREIETLEQQVHESSTNPAPEWHALQIQLAALNYDEKDHALARGEVERWRWAQLKQAELNQARKHLDQIEATLPQLQQTQQELEAQLVTLTQESDLAQALQKLQAEMTALDYDPLTHHQIQAQLRQAQPYLLQWQDLNHAQTRVPELVSQLETLQAHLQQLRQQISQQHTEIETLQTKLATSKPCELELAQLTTELEQHQARLEQYLADLGRLSQQSEHQADLQQQQRDLENQQATAAHHCRIYQELAQAFGKNGIPALIIENLLPQLEAETNHLLGRLTDSQLHVQFVTQKAGRSTKTESKLIETLDILIADTQGTRPYETYSGGEAFRVNFAIRLALSRLLARQSGSDLQLLIIDEGFGTQDQEGCSRLIAALNTIAPDFACILAITHMPQLQAAFQTRISVSKTVAGSHLTVIH